MPRLPGTRGPVSLPRVAVSGFTRTVDQVDRTGVNVAYVARVVASGGLPLILSPAIGAERAAAALAECDGLLLTGGADIAPARYGAEPSAALGRVEPERDAFELALLAAARDRRLPILAICRGMQLVNVATGGTLIQDLPTERPGPVRHEQAAGRSARTHEVRVEPGSRTASLLGTTALRVNSMHHQAVRELGRGLKPTAWAEDGLVEGLEGNGEGGWLAAVQWHPEELPAGGPDDGLFRGFLAEAGRRRG